MQLDASTFTSQLPHGITVVDTGFVRERFDASYLIVQQGRGAFVDTGTNHAVPRLLAAMRQQGLAPDAVDWVILTHVHLDHAGGAGLLMQHLPNAKLVVHARGARHMVDPSALMKGVRAVYGDEVTARDYGDLVPVPAERVVATMDGFTIDLARRSLAFADTPGHAMHHHSIWDEQSRGWFTGDTFGLAYPDVATSLGAHVIPSTTPVQFDPGSVACIGEAHARRRSARALPDALRRSDRCKATGSAAADAGGRNGRSGAAAG